MNQVDAAFPIAETLCPVLESAPVGRRYHRLRLGASTPRPRPLPGQFFHLLCGQGGTQPYLRRPMSVWHTAGDGALGFLFHVTGRGTAALAALRPGDRVSIVGPLGTSFRLEPGWRRILVLARGAGLATLAPLAAAALAQGIAVSAVLSARTAEDLMAAEFCAAPAAAIRGVFDADGTSAPAAVERLLRGMIAQDRPDAVFTCGSNRLLRLLQRLAAEHGIPGQVALEQQMGCGLGMCFCCVRAVNTADGVAHQRVCVEGPVFDLQAPLPC